MYQQPIKWRSDRSENCQVQKVASLLAQALSMSEKRSLEESESTRLEGLYRKASDPVLRTHLLMVWRMSLGDPIREVARMVGYSEKWTREIAKRYESEGVEGLGDRRHHN